MAQAGDLHWERKSAGEYETAFYANGYRYRIVKKENYYDTRPKWYVYYRWHKWIRSDDKPLEWKPSKMTYAETLKEAKANCLKHNMRPRTKYRFAGRVTPEDVRQRIHLPSTLGNLIFIPIDNNGLPTKYRYKYLSEEQYRPGKENELDEKDAP